MRRAAYRPTYPPPTTRILGRSVVLMPSSIHPLEGGSSCAPSQAPSHPLLHCPARIPRTLPQSGCLGSVEGLSTPRGLPFGLTTGLDQSPVPAPPSTPANGLAHPLRNLAWLPTRPRRQKPPSAGSISL